jgi:hypothetical protein
MFVESDIICTDKYLAAFPDNYFKTDVFYNNFRFCWRGSIAAIPSQFDKLIIAGHADYPITSEIVSRYPSAEWRCVNTQTPLASGLPLGITNDCDDSEIHRIYGNTRIMMEVVAEPRNIVNLMYVNFSTNTYPSERVPLLEKFVGKSWATYGYIVPTLEGRKRYLSDIRNHVFTLCPRGNGVDTHRLWEALYMGSIPIVKRDIAHSGWEDLPILWIDSWDEVTEEFLISERVRIESTAWNLEKLKIGYWIK